MEKLRKVTLEIYNQIPSLLLQNSCTLIIYLQLIDEGQDFIFSDIVWYDCETQSFRNSEDASSIYDPDEAIIIGWSKLPVINLRVKINFID